jgi:hypothetical protein
MFSNAQRYKKYHVNRRQDAPKQSGPGKLWLALAGVMVLGCWGISERNAECERPVPAALHKDTATVTAKPQKRRLQMERLLDAIQSVESHGDANAVSWKGARGLFQIMPATAKNPGYGVAPLHGASRHEQRRFAKDFMSAMLKIHHGNLACALAAYNAGPARIGDCSNEWPEETQRYVEKVKQEYTSLIDQEG